MLALPLSFSKRFLLFLCPSSSPFFPFMPYVGALETIPVLSPSVTTTAIWNTSLRVPRAGQRRWKHLDGISGHCLCPRSREQHTCSPITDSVVRQLLAASGPSYNHGSSLAASAPSCLGPTWFSPALLCCLDPLHGSGVYSCSPPNPHPGV